MIRKIESQVRAARRRLRVLRFYEAAIRGLSAATAVAALAFLIDKAFPLPWSAGDRYRWFAWGGLLLLGALGAGVYAAFSRLTLYQSALAVDLRLGLEERFSSAILLRQRADDPAVANLLRDTEHFCDRLHPASDFPFAPTRRHAHYAWPFLALAFVHFVVPANFLSSADTPDDPTAAEQTFTPTERERQAEQIEKIAKRLDDDDDLADALSPFARDLEKLGHDIRRGDKPPRLALAEMSRISDEVRLQRTDLARKFDAFQSAGAPAALAQHTGDMQRALQRNDFDKAEEMARGLVEKFQSDSTPSQKEQAAAELSHLAQQLSRDQPAMAQALEQAAQAMREAADQQAQGDQAAAQQSLEQARQALEQAADEMNMQADAAQLMERLDQLQMSTEQQRRLLASMCQSGACDSGSQSGQGEGQQSDDAANAGQGGQSGQGQQNAPSGNQAGTASCQECGSALAESGNCTRGGCAGSRTGTGQWQPGDTNRTGGGMGGPGMGDGGIAPFDDSVTPSFIDTLPQYEKNPGEIIAVMNVDGPALRGESRIQAQEVWTEYSQKADDALQQEHIPVSLQPLVRDYFDSINPNADRP